MRASVVFNRRISTSYRHLGLRAPDFPDSFRAGQFVMVRSPWADDPFLPRAFSIYRISAPTTAPGSNAPAAIVEILYKVLGKGTQSLARMEPGQAVELLGPLGNSFTRAAGDELAVLVAGGIGVPPIAAFAAELVKSREPRAESRENPVSRAASREPRAASRETPDPDPQTPTPAVEVFLGGKTSEDILCLKDFEGAGVKVHITTEDGGLGTRGLITDLLGPFLLSPSASPLTMYTCGPPGMLAAVARLAAGGGIPCQASVEANMACGFGACMGCAVEAAGETRTYRLVCKDGPVFDSREIKWTSHEPQQTSHEP